MVTIKHLDTYVLWEINRGNPRFLQYLQEPFLISELTLVEYYGVLLREYNDQTAEYWIRQLKKHMQLVPFEILLKAMKFRDEKKKQDISFFDAVGYIFAKESGAIFVTGDKEFKDLPSVEFIKA